MKLRALSALGPLALCMSLAGVAGAQDGGFAVNQLQPSPAGDAFFGVPSPYVRGHLDPSAYVLFDYAHQPIRLLSDEDKAVLSSQGFLRIDASLALWERLLVSVDVPLAVVLKGEDPAVAGTTFTSLESPKIGDIRGGLRGRLVGDDGGPFQLGLGGYVFFPSGDPEHYVGNGRVRGGPHAVIGGRVGEGIGFMYSVVAGAEFRGAGSPHVLTYGAAAGLLLADDLLQIGPEFYGVSALTGDDLQLSSTPTVAVASGTNAEVSLSAKLRLFDGLTIGAAGGPGLGSIVGTPIFRAMGLLGWTPLPGPSPDQRGDVAVAVGDKDDDGINDALDACPDVAGEPNPDPAKDGCPPSDRDTDGVLDMDDACPSTAGLRSSDATKNGCPADSDDDGYHDGIDACVKVPGDASDDPAKVGCPADDDGDGVANRADACPKAAGDRHDDPLKSGCPADPDDDGIRYGADACPREKGFADPDPQKNGCPRYVRVVQGAIQITQGIVFETYGSSMAGSVTAGSARVLREVADVIKGHPEIKLVEVQGHTDDSGDADFNMELSERRAEAVRQWLIVNGGVDSGRLTAKGYGFTRPIADNRLRMGRQANRRVEFVIVEQ